MLNSFKLGPSKATLFQGFQASHIPVGQHTQHAQPECLLVCCLAEEVLAKAFKFQLSVDQNRMACIRYVLAIFGRCRSLCSKQTNPIGADAEPRGFFATAKGIPLVGKQLSLWPLAKVRAERCHALCSGSLNIWLQLDAASARACEDTHVYL